MSRGQSRGRIVALEAFVLAWDEYIGLSVHVNTMNPADEAFEQTKGRLKVKHAAVVSTRNRIGALRG